jgi:hypothetical protein
MRLSALFMAATGFAQGIDPAQDPTQDLVRVRRIFVDKLMASLQATKLWVITENPDKADAFLRGAADDLIYSETRESRDGVDARAALSTRNGALGSRRANGNFASVGVGQNEAERVQERKHEATAAMRLVNKDGDLIWSTTKESSGAKFKGAAADVTDKVVKQLVADVEAARRPVSRPASQ